MDPASSVRVCEYHLVHVIAFICFRATPPRVHRHPKRVRLTDVGLLLCITSTQACGLLAPAKHPAVSGQQEGVIASKGQLHDEILWRILISVIEGLERLGRLAVVSLYPA